MINHKYQISGTLSSDAPTYVERLSDAELYQALKRGEFCYILNSRQVGKSSLLVRTKNRLQQEGFRCIVVDLTSIGSNCTTPAQWYKGVLNELWLGVNPSEEVNFNAWWQKHEDVSLTQRFVQFISEVLFVQFPHQRFFILIDEIDSILSLDFPVDDFFALIRFCYNRRAVNPDFNRITFAICGVATPSDLIADRKRTPFSIGRAIQLQGFTLDEVKPLAQELTVYGDSQVILKEILTWTGGQPFLTQKLCQLAIGSSRDTVSGVLTIPPGTEAFWVESVVRKHIIAQWDSQDEPEHLRIVRNRLLCNEKRAGRMLGIYRQLLEKIKVPVDNSREQIELLLSGLVVQQQGYLQIANSIYQAVFNREWVEKQLYYIRPYSRSFDAWVASDRQDKSQLLQEQALKDALIWALGKNLSDLDYTFLAASQELDRQEVRQALKALRTNEVTVQLVEEEKQLAQEGKTNSLLKILVLVMTIKLLLALGWGVVCFLQYQKVDASQQYVIVTDRWDIKSVAV